MKVNKILSLILALCITAALVSFTNVKAYAAVPHTVYLGETYDLEEMLESLGYEKLDGEDTYMGGRYAKYYMYRDADGNDVSAAEEDLSEQFSFDEEGEYIVSIYKTVDNDKEFSILFEVVPEPVKRVNRISGVTYNLSDLLTCFGLEKLEGKSSVTDGRVARYRLYMFDGENVGEDDTDHPEAAFANAGSTVEFKTTGVYLFEVYKDEIAAENLEKVYYITVNENVEAVDEDYNATSVKYNDDLSGYAEKVAEAAANLITGDSFSVPSLEDYIDSADFAYNTLQKVVYYCAPDATSFTQGSSVTTSSASFTVNKLGTYAYYVLFTDVFGNKMTTDNLVLGEGGWYKTVDNDGETAYGGVVIPVFSFNVGNVKAPEISVKVSENAYLGLSYEIKTFNIVADDYSTVYKLYYSEINYDKDSDEYESDRDYIIDVTSKCTDITEDYLDKDALTFTPDKKGYYYVQVRVVDEHNNEEVAVSRSIACLGEAKSVSPESEFAKNNVTSIVFLSIAGVCLIAIIVLLIVPAKEKQKVEVEGEDNTTK